jgi:hypothetical protein
MVEVYAAGLQAMQRRRESLHPLEDLIVQGFSAVPEPPRFSPERGAEGLEGAVFTLAYRRLRESGADALPALAPICTYITLSPFVGAEEACRVANGGGGRGRVQGRNR